MENMKNRFGIIKHIAMLTAVVVLLTGVSYSWIRREWTPSIEQSNIKIVTGGALVFQVGDGDGFKDSETINEILGIENFELKPVSNCTGESDDFFTLNFNDEMGWEKYEHLSLSKYTDYTSMGKANGYLEFNFTLFAPDGESVLRHIYLDEAYIRDSGGNASYYSDCVRVSITNKTTGDTWIFSENSNDSEKKAITNEKAANGQYVANGALYYETYDPASESNSVPATTIIYKNGTSRNNTEKPLEVPQECRSFDSVNGKKPNGNYDIDKTLFTLNSGSSSKGVTIVVRIWLEGADPKCKTTDILQPEVDLKLKFSSFTNMDLELQETN